MFENLPFSKYNISVPEFSPGNRQFGFDQRQKDADLELTMTGTMSTFSMPPTSSFAEKKLFHMESFSIFSCEATFITRRKNYRSYLILYTYAGEGRLEYEGKTYQIAAGDGFMIDCMKPHVYLSEREAWEHSVLHFNGPLMEPLFRSFIKNGNVKFSQPMNGTYHNKLIKLLNMYTENIPALEWQASTCLDAMVTELLANSLNESNMGLPEVIESLKRIIEGEYAKNISMDELAIRVGMSKYHLSREFKKYTEFSPYNYLIQVRLDRARALLLGTEMTIGEIANRVGFTDVNNFIKLFKKRTGMTPGRFRGY